MGHVDLWEQLLREIEQAGAAVRWLHVPSHVGIVGNTHADTLADMGRCKSPLLRGYVTSARRPKQEDQAQEQEDESDLDEPPMFSPEEQAANPPPRDTPPDPPRTGSHTTAGSRRLHPSLQEAMPLTGLH